MVVLIHLRSSLLFEEARGDLDVRAGSALVLGATPVTQFLRTSANIARCSAIRNLEIWNGAAARHPWARGNDDKTTRMTPARMHSRPELVARVYLPLGPRPRLAISVVSILLLP